MLHPHADFHAKTLTLHAPNAPKPTFGVNTQAKVGTKKGSGAKVARFLQQAHCWKALKKWSCFAPLLARNDSLAGQEWAKTWFSPHFCHVNGGKTCCGSSFTHALRYAALSRCSRCTGQMWARRIALHVFYGIIGGHEMGKRGKSLPFYDPANPDLHGTAPLLF